MVRLSNPQPRAAAHQPGGSVMEKNILLNGKLKRGVIASWREYFYSAALRDSFFDLLEKG